MAEHENPAQLLLQAIEIGMHVVQIADAIGEDIAANHIASGLAILQARVDLALEFGNSPLDQGKTLG